MKYLAGWRGVVYSATSGCFDLVVRCYRVTLCGRPDIQLACGFCLAYLYVPNFKHRLQKILLVEKNDWLKNRPFFITENFQGILDRLCTEPMRRIHDFLSLTQAVVGSTSGSCYFLIQCRCMWVWPRATLDLAGVEKREVILDSAAPKSDFFLFV